MKLLKSFLSKASFVIMVTALSAVGVKAMGTLEPQGEAGDDTHKSLKDILNKLTDFSNTPEALSSPFATPGVAVASFPTLTEIYQLLEDEEADLIPANIRQGVTVFGVGGELVPATAIRLQWSADSADDTYINARNYCLALDEAGETDWRLPNITELFEGYFDGSLPDFAGTGRYWAWESGDGHNSSGSTFVVDPTDGSVYFVSIPDTNDFTCVRDDGAIE